MEKVRVYFFVCAWKYTDILNVKYKRAFSYFCICMWHTCVGMPRVEACSHVCAQMRVSVHVQARG